MPRPPVVIERISPPSPRDFERDYVRRSRPVVITGLADGWRAMSRWTPEYFKETFGTLPAAVIRLRDGHVFDDPGVGVEYEDTTFARAIDLVFSGEKRDASDPALDRDAAPTGVAKHYLVTKIAGPLARLRDDVSSPPYCVRGPLMRSRLFIGAGGTVSGLHRDFPENLFAQIVGRKRMTLIPPEDMGGVYALPLLSKLPQASLIDAERPDFERFPRFRTVRRVMVDVGPGDVLYLPSRWWHQVRALEPSISINWWWPQGVVNTLRDGFEILQKRVRRVRW
ncbi:Pass1-related protein [Minicystis rosea]|nr:Pass1-related protein [Minicystis rosea]